MCRVVHGNEAISKGILFDSRDFIIIIMVVR